MAISVSFNGATIFKPGAYSKVEIDLGGGFPLSPTGLVLVLGESSNGTPGALQANIQNNFFTPDQLPALVQEYGTGPICDTASFLFAPALDGAIPGGAQAIYVWKTNNSTQASFTLSNTYGMLQDLQWGTNGNQLTYSNTLVSEVPATTTGSVAIPPGSFPNTSFSGLTLSVAQNGLAPVTWTGAASYASQATLLADLDTQLPGLTFTFNAGNELVMVMNAGVNLQRNGWGRSFEIESTSTALTALGLVSGLYVPSVEPAATITLTQPITLTSEQDTVGGNVTMTLGFTAGALDATSATVTISASTLTLTVVGGAQAGVHTFTLNAFSALSQLVAAISLVPGWTAAIANTLYGQLPVSVLDQVTGVGALSVDNSMPARIKKDAYEVQQLFAVSSLEALVNPKEVGLPDAQTQIALSGGTLGGTSTADIVNGLAVFQNIRINSVVPLFSRDATADIADGLTSPTSTYTIEGIHQAVKTHLSLTASTKNKSERQGYLSLKDTFNNCIAESQNLAYYRIQLAIQDIRQTNALGNIIWFQPYALAAILAGARGGAPIGEPLTFKYMNVSGIRSTAQSMNTPDALIVNSFDPNTQYDEAIQNGITFLEQPQSGGFRLVLDNTTYGQDANWVYNRANVLYAADVLIYDFRRQLENIYVGVKNTVKATEIAATCKSILATYLAQGITVATATSPNGFSNLVVTLVGNTINISVVVTLVEGIDFILADITLQRAQSTATI